MKKALVTVLLAFATVAIAQQPTQPTQPAQPGQTTAQPSQGNTPVQQKTIKDPQEYNSYITALNTADPAQKAAAMEAFVKQYPQSVVLVDALEQAMAAYQQIGNTNKVLELARRILQLNPNNIRGLAIVVAIDRNLATQGNQDAMKEGCANAQTGLAQLPSWQKPPEVPDADFEKLKTQMANIFNGDAGFCALQAKNFTQAQGYYTKAYQIEPNDLQNVYQLAISYLETDPIDLRGLWYGAKALSLAGNNAAAANSIGAYVKSKYKKYHGKVDDWDKFAATVGPQTAPPTPQQLATLITPAPTPCDFAVQAVKDNKPEDLSFSDKEFILSKANCSPANKEAADQVWQSIQTLEKGGEARLEIPVKVVSATTDSLEVAVSEDNQAANPPKADMHVDLEKPVTKPPAPGTTTKIVGVITKYTPDPFLFTMEKGALPAEKKPPVHHAPVKKKKKGK